MNLRERLARRLRLAADRIDPKQAPRRITPYSFTFEAGEGIRFRQDGKGCPLWHGGEADCARAHTEADRGRRWTVGPSMKS